MSLSKISTRVRDIRKMSNEKYGTTALKLTLLIPLGWSNYCSTWLPSIIDDHQPDFLRLSLNIKDVNFKFQRTLTRTHMRLLAINKLTVAVLKRLITSCTSTDVCCTFHKIAFVIWVDSRIQVPRIRRATNTLTLATRAYSSVCDKKERNWALRFVPQNFAVTFALFHQNATYRRAYLECLHDEPTVWSWIWLALYVSVSLEEKRTFMYFMLFLLFPSFPKEIPHLAQMLDWKSAYYFIPNIFDNRELQTTTERGLRIRGQLCSRYYL